MGALLKFGSRNSQNTCEKGARGIKLAENPYGVKRESSPYLLRNKEYYAHTKYEGHIYCGYASEHFNNYLINEMPNAFCV